MKYKTRFYDEAKQNIKKFVSQEYPSDMIREMHIVIAYGKRKPLDMIETGDYNDGNFKKAIIYAIDFMKNTANKKDYEGFITWLNIYLTKNESDFYITNCKKEINAANISVY